MADIEKDQNIQSPREEIEDLLNQTRWLIENGDDRVLYVRKRREKNLAFMQEHNIYDNDVADMVYRLALENYCHTSQETGKADAYVFGTHLNDEPEVEVYLKYNLRPIGGQMQIQIDVISFHDPERNLTYPYR